MSHDRSPGLMAAIAAVVALTLGGWVFLRAIESDDAASTASSVATAQGQLIETSIGASIDRFDRVADSLTLADSADASFLATTAARAEVTSEDSSVTEIALVAVDGDSLVVLANVGAVDASAFVGRSIDRAANTDEVLARARDAGVSAVAVPELQGAIERIFESDTTSVVLIAPVTDPTGSERYLLGLYEPGRDARVDPSVDMRISVELDALSVATDASFEGSNQASIDIASFEAANADWRVVAIPAESSLSHRGSWILLVAGLAIASGISVVAWALQLSRAGARRLARIEFDARHDPLTGLTNRKGLTDELAASLSDRRTNNLVGVLLLDLDRLKVVNDSIGHSAGDEVLAAVAERLRHCVREGDTVGRFGGDEFIVVSSGVPAIRDLTMLADRILESLREPAVLSDESSQMISASIGIAYVTGGSGDAESLLRDADVAMYKAKEAGGGRYVVFDADLREQAVARLEVERELRRAIRTGQLHVHYQPIVNCRDVERGSAGGAGAVGASRARHDGARCVLERGRRVRPDRRRR